MDRDTEKELDAMVEILKELDIESDKKDKITSKKTEQKSKNKKIPKKEILKMEAAKKSKKITQFFSKKPAAAAKVVHEPMEVDKADIAQDEDMEVDTLSWEVRDTILSSRSKNCIQRLKHWSSS